MHVRGSASTPAHGKLHVISGRLHTHTRAQGAREARGARATSKIGMPTRNARSTARCRMPCHSSMSSTVALS